MKEWLWQAHTFSVVFMCGVIWVIQGVHYPLMRFVDLTRFQEFHEAHSARITAIVALPMLVQLISAAALTVFFENQQGPMNSSLALTLSLAVFLVTAIFSVPCHNRLAKGFDPKVHRQLVRTNGLRTFLWSVHALLLFV